MDHAIRAIRNSAKAVIVQNGHILLTKNADDRGVFYLFPGGGQEPGEELKDAVVRECIEETGMPVSVGELLHVREYIGRNHEFADTDSGVHQVEFYFACSVETGGPEPVMNGDLPDSNQIGVEWVPLKALTDVRVYPSSLGAKLAGMLALPCYMGDAN
jgi:8-oxo-dGTP diphosphatase